MKADIPRFYTLQRRIFGICPKCTNFFRLSDCKIFSKKKPVRDWMDEIDLENQRLEKLEEKLLEKKKELQAAASAEGRRRAQLRVRKLDPVFAPRKLDPDDARVIFHPIDYVVFNGMNTAETIKNIVLLDRRTSQLRHRKLQQSIERVIDQEKYYWQTLCVGKNGEIKTQ